MSNYTAKWGITFNPFLIAQAGHPFNITTDTDLTGDNFFNDRPSFAASTSSCTGSSQYVQTSFGCLDTVPQPGEKLLPANLGNSPASVAVNLRVSRSWGLGPEVASAAQRRGGAGGPGGPGGGGGFGGGGFGGPAVVGQVAAVADVVVAVALAVEAVDARHVEYRPQILAHLQRTGVEPLQRHRLRHATGSVVPTLLSGTGTTAVYGPGSRFNKSTSLAGGIFASPTGSAARRIFLQAAFSF